MSTYPKYKALVRAMGLVKLALLLAILLRTL